MTVGAWTYDVIAKATRNYCSMPSMSQLSSANLLAQINRYYRWVLPTDLRPMQLQSWYQVTLSSGDANYHLVQTNTSTTFYNQYSVLGSLAYVSKTSSTIDGIAVGYKEDKIDVYFEPSSFYEMWPDNKDYNATANLGQPSGVLVYNNYLLFRKSPDDTYYFSIEAWRRPRVNWAVVGEAIVYVDYFSGNTDRPQVDEWGNLIALGTAKQILLELGDDESMQRVEGMYQRELSRINSQTLLWQSSRRPAPKF